MVHLMSQIQPERSLKVVIQAVSEGVILVILSNERSYLERDTDGIYSRHDTLKARKAFQMAKYRPPFELNGAEG